MIDPATKIVGSCPLNGKLCSDGIRSDFEKASDGLQKKCKWWQHVYGKDPQGEKIVDQFDCSIPWLTVTTVETAQMAHQAGASTDKVANEVRALKTDIASLAGAIRVAAADIRQGIESGALQVMLPPPGSPQIQGENHRDHEKS